MDEEMKDLMAAIEKARNSANAQFCARIMPRYVSAFRVLYYKAYGDEKAVRNLLGLSLRLGFDGEEIEGEDELYQIGISFFGLEEENTRVTIFELPRAEAEWECNYLCLAYCEKKDYKQVYYLLSERYEDGRFGLCRIKGDGTHINYGFNYGNIQTRQDMENACKAFLLSQVGSEEE